MACLALSVGLDNMAEAVEGAGRAATKQQTVREFVSIVEPYNNLHGL